MAIRYDKALNKEINRVIGNFNSKIRRLEKSERNLIIPDTITKRELKESVGTRADLYRKLNTLKSYSKRGAEETMTLSSGNEISRYEYLNLKKESARLKRNLTREIKRYETTAPRVLGKVQKGTFAQMGDTAYLTAKAKREALEKDITKIDKATLERYKKMIDRLSRNKIYMDTRFKENYSKMLTDLGYYYDYDKTKLEQLEKTLNKLPSDKFLRLFQEDKSIRAILDYYPVISDNLGSIDPEDIRADVNNLYDALIDDIDDIISPYA